MTTTASVVLQDPPRVLRGHAAVVAAYIRELVAEPLERRPLCVAGE
jgi:hypothetical protein